MFKKSFVTHGDCSSFPRFNSAKYEGEYLDNKRSGYGMYVHADGRTYTGEYLNDRPHGKGVLTDPKGVVINEGTWVNGEFIRTA